MSGFEVVGVVLGALPIIVKCLNKYREGFEPLEQWWMFRTHFSNFVDDFQEQTMEYEMNVESLLDHVITDRDERAVLSQFWDERWRNGSLERALKDMLPSEHDRVLYILGRIHKVVGEVEKSLQIQDGRVCRQL